LLASAYLRVVLPRKVAASSATIATPQAELGPRNAAASITTTYEAVISTRPARGTTSTPAIAAATSRTHASELAAARSLPTCNTATTTHAGNPTTSNAVARPRKNSWPPGSATAELAIGES
jgi:hypothetical protein